MSFQNELTLSEARLKTAAKHLKKELTALTGEKFGHAESLQLISQALFSKPFEEVKALMAQCETADAVQPVSNAFNPVMLVSYGSETYLLNGADYIGMMAVGTDMEIPYRALYQQAVSLSVALGFEEDALRLIDLPEILPEDYEIDDLLKVVEALGYTRYEKPLIELIEEKASAALIEGHYTPYLLDGDWVGEAANEEDGCLSATVWHAECKESYEMYEFFFSLGDIGRAERVSDDEWLVPEGAFKRRIKLLTTLASGW